jgi:hypothetical protein
MIGEPFQEIRGLILSIISGRFDLLVFSIMILVCQYIKVWLEKSRRIRFLSCR